MTSFPVVLIHILAKSKGSVLEYWLKQNLDKTTYPKNKIILFFRTNNNTDNTKQILLDWIGKQHPTTWNSVYFNDEDVPEKVEQYGVHEWNTLRLSVISRLRQEGLVKSLELNADFYFSCDVDNFLIPETLQTLVDENLPVIAPLLKYACCETTGKNGNAYDNPNYSNFHHPVTSTGYFLDSPAYYTILNQDNPGLHVIDLVHCTYLVRKDAIEKSSYIDVTTDFDYIIFARTLRKCKIPQVFDTRKIYGYLTVVEDIDACKLNMARLDKNSTGFLQCSK